MQRLGLTWFAHVVNTDSIAALGTDKEQGLILTKNTDFNGLGFTAFIFGAAFIVVAHGGQPQLKGFSGFINSCTLSIKNGESAAAALFTVFIFVVPFIGRGKGSIINPGYGVRLRTLFDLAVKFNEIIFLGINIVQYHFPGRKIVDGIAGDKVYNGQMIIFLERDHGLVAAVDVHIFNFQILTCKGPIFHIRKIGFGDFPIFGRSFKVNDKQGAGGLLGDNPVVEVFISLIFDNNGGAFMIRGQGQGVGLTAQVMHGNNLTGIAVNHHQLTGRVVIAFRGVNAHQHQRVKNHKTGRLTADNYGTLPSRIGRIRDIHKAYGTILTVSIHQLFAVAGDVNNFGNAGTIACHDIKCANMLEQLLGYTMMLLFVLRYVMAVGKDRSRTQAQNESCCCSGKLFHYSSPSFLGCLHYLKQSRVMEKYFNLRT